MEKLTYYFNKKLFNIEIIRTRNKNMYLKVKENKVFCSAPIKYSDKDIKEFVDKYAEKFFNYISKAKQNELYSLRKNFIYINGKKYKINRLIGFSKPNIIIQSKKIDIYTKDNEDDSINKILKNFLKTNTLNYMKIRQKYFEKKMKIQHHDIRVVYKKSNWGTNMVLLKKISYSSRIAHFNEEIKDYLIVHELSHNKHPNHSKDFWNLVKKYCPNYKILREKLRESKAEKD
ncbi:MAG: M48 family metallopeptidase [Mycoplasma sp.]|nr:M48 family metallopeptidase [Mycoplasma sp.]